MSRKSEICGDNSAGLRRENVLFCKNKASVREIYNASFPKRERMPFFLMLILSCIPTTRFYAFYDGEILCGLIYMAKLGRQAYILFFAVDEKLRSRGYGSLILQQLRARFRKCNIAVSIERCCDGVPDLPLRIRRKNFYIRNGYSDSGYDITLSGIRQELLVSGHFNRFLFSLFLIAYSCFAIIPILHKRGQ